MKWYFAYVDIVLFVNMENVLYPLENMHKAMDNTNDKRVRDNRFENGGNIWIYVNNDQVD